MNMKKIVLLCAAGMSTSLLVTKMKAAAKEERYESEIDAYSLSEAETACIGADIILLGPQVRHNQAKLKGQFPDIPVEVIDMRAYGTMNGKAIIKMVQNKLDS